MQYKDTLDEKAKLASTARREIEQDIANLRVQRALRHNVPPSANIAYEPADKVIVWREKLIANRVGEWLGLFQFNSVDNYAKPVYLLLAPESDLSSFSFSQVKPYVTASEVSYTHLCELLNGIASYRSDAGDSYMTKIQSSRSPRAHEPRMTTAKKAKLRELLERGTFKGILKEEISLDGNVLPGLLVLTIKYTEDGQETFKAQYVIGGHRNRVKHLMAH